MRLTERLQMCIYTSIWNLIFHICLSGKDHISIYGPWSIIGQSGSLGKSILILNHNTMQIKQHLTTASKTAGTNTCELVIVHHTATKENTIKGVLAHLTNSGKASCQYVVDTNGDLYKIGEDKDILWHAGESAWKGKTNLNRYSIGIEIIGPLSDGGFTDAQRATVATLIKELCQKYSIPKENVLRHADLTHAWSSKGILWDGKSASRKVDVAQSFWSKFSSWDEYRSSLFHTNQPTMEKSKYTEIMQGVLKETGFAPVFSSHDGDKPLTEQETKELIEIAMARLFQRMTKKQ